MWRMGWMNTNTKTAVQIVVNQYMSTRDINQLCDDLTDIFYTKDKICGLVLVNGWEDEFK